MLIFLRFKACVFQSGFTWCRGLWDMFAVDACTTASIKKQSQARELQIRSKRNFKQRTFAAKMLSNACSTSGERKASRMPRSATSLRHLRNLFTMFDSLESLHDKNWQVSYHNLRLGRLAAGSTVFALILRSGSVDPRISSNVTDQYVVRAGSRARDVSDQGRVESDHTNRISKPDQLHGSHEVDQ